MVAGGIKDGKRFNAVVWRRTSCKVCGQARIDKCYEFYPDENPNVGSHVKVDFAAENASKTTIKKTRRRRKKAD
jgi:hypothetical protein